MYIFHMISDPLTHLIFTRAVAIENIEKFKSQKDKHKEMIGVHFGSSNLWLVRKCNIFIYFNFINILYIFNIIIIYILYTHIYDFMHIPAAS